jgi:hypothetical protein
VAVLLEEGDVRGVERAQPLHGGRSRPERRRAAQDAVLQVALVLVEQGRRDRRAVRVAAVEGALADPRRGRDLLHGRPARVLREQAGGSVEHPQAVALGVRALGSHRGEA